MCRRPRTGRSLVFHAIAVTRKMPAALLLRSRPTKRELRRFRTRAPAVHRAVADSGARRRKPSGWLHQKPADLVIDWVAASRFITDTKNSAEAAEAFGKLFSRRIDMTHDELMNSLERVSRDVIRLARVRVDAVACLVAQG